jgi:hypothetical protein
MLVEPLNPYAPPQPDSGAAQSPQRLDTLADIFLKGTTLYVSNAPALLGVVAVICGPLELLRTYHYYFIASAVANGESYFVGWLLDELVRLLFFGATIAIGNSAMREERPTIWYGVRHGIDAWPRMIVTELVVGSITLLALLVFIVPGVYVICRSALVGQIAVIERLGGMASMKRSFQLTEGQSFRYFALLGALTAIMLFLSAVLWLPMTLVPELNQWLVAAGLSLAVDVINGWSRLVLVAAYWAAAKPLGKWGEEPMMPAEADADHEAGASG